MGVWPAGATGSGVICLPLVQSCDQWRGHVGQRPLLPDLGVVGEGCVEGKAEELSLTGVTAAELGRY